MADQVIPGKTYEYEVHINGVYIARPYPLSFQSLPQWKPDGQPPEFTVAAGSCSFINDPDYYYEDRGSLGGDYQIFESIYGKTLILCSGLVIIFICGNADWNTRTGIHYRYTYDRALPELQPLLGSVHHYATWMTTITVRMILIVVLCIRKSLQMHLPTLGNPSFGMPDMPGVMTAFTWVMLIFYVG